MLGLELFILNIFFREFPASSGILKGKVRDYFFLCFNKYKHNSNLTSFTNVHRFYTIFDRFK